VQGNAVCWPLSSETNPAGQGNRLEMTGEKNSFQTTKNLHTIFDWIDTGLLRFDRHGMRA